jgi:hypothetical protein
MAFSVDFATPCSPIARSTATWRFPLEDPQMTNPRKATWRRLWRLFRSWGDKVLILAVIVAAAIAFTRLDSRVIRPSRAVEAEDRPGSGVVVRGEVVHLWFPEILLDEARHQPISAVARSHGEARSLPEPPGREKLWYALTIRGHQQNGRYAHVTHVRHPYRNPEHFSEFLKALATAAGHPPIDSTPDFSKAEVHIIPGELSEREPSEVVEELLSRQFPPFERSQGSSRGRNRVHP